MLGKLFDEHRGRLLAMIERRLSPCWPRALTLKTF